MIFVTVGTTRFDDLVRHLDDYAQVLVEDVVCQIGHGSYAPRHCSYFRFSPSLDDYMRRARLVVSHGGLASITEALRRSKRVIGVSNPDRRDRHQDDLLATLEGGGHLLWCRSLQDLASCIDRVAMMDFVAYHDPPCHIHWVIDDFLHPQAGPSARRRG
jgi:UDP-N-acetylglucosamine transferase subunit ALG13